MLQDAIQQAKKAHRKVIEAVYDGTCTVYEYKSHKDKVTKVTSHKEEIVLANQPCHLSYSSFPAASSSDTVTAISQVIKLFIASEVDIKPGAKIVITQNGRTESYRRSGAAAIYSSHQEITLELWKEKT